jgi:bifunctional non-homologous end joining protein LigD
MDSRCALVIGYQTRMLHPVGFIEPCLPTNARSVPSGPQWAYEIKHDGFRFVCWRACDRVRVFSRQGVNWTERRG